MFSQFTNPLKCDMRWCKDKGCFAWRKRRRWINRTIGFLAVMTYIVREGNWKRNGSTMCQDIRNMNDNNKYFGESILLLLIKYHHSYHSYYILANLQNTSIVLIQMALGALNKPSTFHSIYCIIANTKH